MGGCCSRSASYAQTEPRADLKLEEEENDEEQFPLFDPLELPSRTNPKWRPLVMFHSVVFNLPGNPECPQILEAYMKLRQDYVPLRDLISDVEIPAGATHVLVTFFYQKKDYKIPFSLQHTEDRFPCDNLHFLHDDQPRPFLIRSLADKPPNALDVTSDLKPMSYQCFTCGFNRFRPYAWTWPTMEQTVIVAFRHNNHDELEVATLDLRGSGQLVPWRRVYRVSELSAALKKK